MELSGSNTLHKHQAAPIKIQIRQLKRLFLMYALSLCVWWGVGAGGIKIA